MDGVDGAYGAYGDEADDVFDQGCAKFYDDSETNLHLRKSRASSSNEVGTAEPDSTIEEVADNEMEFFEGDRVKWLTPEELGYPDYKFIVQGFSTRGAITESFQGCTDLPSSFKMAGIF